MNVNLTLITKEMKQCRPGDWEHAKRVAEWVDKLASGKENLDILKYAAYIHDIGWKGLVPSNKLLTKDQLKSIEPDANKNSIKNVREISRKLMLNNNDTEIVLGLITAADKHESSNVDEEIIVDADNLSKLCREHLQEKYQRSDWQKIVNLWETEFPKRIKTDIGKSIYPKLLVKLKTEI